MALFGVRFANAQEMLDYLVTKEQQGMLFIGIMYFCMISWTFALGALVYKIFLTNEGDKKKKKKASKRN